MPIYTFECLKCEKTFEHVCSIKSYNGKAKCPSCSSKKTTRCYTDDVATINGSVKKSDSELKTLGDLAMRNTERLTEDQKQEIYKKNNSYKETPSDKPLPKGMSRIKKPPKTKWT